MNAAAAIQGEEEECVPRAAQPKTRVTKKRKKDSDDDEEEESDIQEDEEEDFEVEPEEMGGDSDEEEYDLSKYNYLIEKPHYDPEDTAVFKCSVIGVNAQGDVVVYRSKYNSESGKWSRVNMGDPIHVAAVVRGDKKFRNIRQMNAILQSKPPSPLKQANNKKRRK